MKKLLIMLLMLSLVFAITACDDSANGQPPAGEAKGSFTPGTYTGSTNSFGGKLALKVTVDANNITDIQLAEFNDTVMLGDTAFERISKQALEHQSLDLDMVSGATFSSAAVITALTDALTQAEANIESLQAKEIVKKKPEKTAWETDVVVVGSGLAGIAAAIEAAENGADVILLEKLGRVGGTSALSAGWVHAAGTDVQKSLGIEDSAEKFYEDWMNLAARSDENNIEPEFVRYLTEHSAENVQWLIDHGVNMIQPFAAGIYEGRNIPRIHQAEGGKGYIIKGVYEAAEKLGVVTHLDTRAMELIKEGNTVTGVKAVDKDGNELTYKAKSVILASGGYAGNKEMMAEYHPNLTDYVNSSVNVGDTLVMGAAVGADIIFQEALLMHHSLATDSSLGYFTPECVYITPEGERYVDEAEYFYTRSRELREAGFEDTFMLVPQKLYEEKKAGIDQAIENGKAFKTDSIEELAIKMGMKPEVLKNTIDRYNEMVSAGKDSDFNKAAEYLLPIEAPYIGLDLIGGIVDTTSSLRVNINAQVIDTEGNAIDGLYAAGAAAVAQMYNQEYIGSGAALLNGLTFGRIAGAHATTK